MFKSAILSFYLLGLLSKKIFLRIIAHFNWDSDYNNVSLLLQNQYTSIRRKSKESQVIIPGYAPEAK